MNIRVKFFGSLTELTGTPEISIPAASTDECLQKILQRYPLLHGQTFALALNARIINEGQLVQEGDVLAFLPPFSGG